MTVIARIAGAERVSAQPAATAAVAEACGHLPLALRLAAATLALDPELGIEELSERLADGDRRPTLADSGRYLDTVFASSCSQLTADQRLVFRRLSVHPGPEPGAEAVSLLTGLPVSQAELALAALAEAHLIEPTEGGRYRMHDLLREYAGRLTADEEDPVVVGIFREILFDWYVEQAHSVSAALAPGSARLYLTPSPATELEDAAGWLAGQQRNVIAAIAADSAGPHAWALIDLLGVVLLRRQDVADLLIATDAGIAVAERQQDSLAAAAVRTVRGWLHWRQGHAEAARTDFEYALQGFADRGHQAGQAAVLLGLVAPCATHGELERAERYARQALDCYRSLGDLHGQATTLNASANLAHLAGDLVASGRHFRESARLLRTIGDQGNLAVALGNLSWVCAEVGRQDEAIACSTEAVTLARAVGDRYALTLALINGAVAREQHGALDDGLDWARAAVDEAEAIGDLSFRTSALDVLATVERRLGMDRAAAGRKRQQALELARGCHDRTGEARLLVSAARDACDQVPPDWVAVAELAEQARGIAAEQGARIVEGEALALLAGCALAGPDGRDRATMLAETAVRLQVEAGARLCEARARTVLAAALGATDRAEQEWQRAQQLLTELKAPGAAQRTVIL